MPEKEQWHLDKRLNVGHLLTTISVAGLLVIWAMNMESRIAEHEVRITTNAKQLEKSEQRTTQTFEHQCKSTENHFRQIHLLSNMFKSTKKQKSIIKASAAAAKLKSLSPLALQACHELAFVCSFIFLV